MGRAYSATSADVGAALSGELGAGLAMDTLALYPPRMLSPSTAHLLALQLRQAPRPPSWARDWLADFAVEGGVWGVSGWQWLMILVMLVVAGLLGAVLGWLVVRVSGALAKTTGSDWDDRLVARARGPVRVLIAVALFVFGVELLDLAEEPREQLGRVIRIAATLAFAWLIVRAVRLVSTLMEERAVALAEQEGDAIKARGVRTQILVLERVAIIAVWVLALALILMQYEVVRSVGVSLLASAGVAGIVLGLAAQKSIGNLLGGIQLSVTQPVRIGDTIIVEGEWGEVEDITLTYVVVRIWDQRRLIVPVSRFLDQPFENWTRTETELVGTVYFHADYRLPVDAAREELARVLASEDNWDERVGALLVTDVSERTIQLRATVSAPDAGSAWMLRCSVRERMIAWLRGFEGGRYLPVLRVDAEASPEPRD